MKVLVDFKNNFMFTSVDNVKELTHPLRCIGITFFSFLRVFADGSHIRLCNHAEWTEHYYKQRFYHTVLTQIPKCNSHLFWSHIDCPRVFNDASKRFNIDHGIVLVEPKARHTDYYFFGSTRDNPTIYAFYTCHLNLLYRYAFYFKEKGQPLINQAMAHKIIMPTDYCITPQDKSISKITTDAMQLKQATPTKRFFVTIGEQEFVFTRREIQILTLMKTCMTSKEMAKRLNVTSHTIECHRENIRKKLGSHCNALNKTIQSACFNEDIW